MNYVKRPEAEMEKKVRCRQRDKPAHGHRVKHTEKHTEQHAEKCTE